MWTTLIVIIAVWDLVWKAIALWRASQRKEVIWFVILLVLNTAGILPILYIILRPAPGEKSLVETISSNKESTNKSAAKKTVGKKSTTKKPVKSAEKKKSTQKKVVKKTSKKTSKAKGKK